MNDVSETVDDHLDFPVAPGTLAIVADPDLVHAGHAVDAAAGAPSSLEELGSWVRDPAALLGLVAFALVSVRQFGWLLFERGGTLETLLPLCDERGVGESVGARLHYQSGSLQFPRALPCVTMRRRYLGEPARRALQNPMRLVGECRYQYRKSP